MVLSNIDPALKEEWDPHAEQTDGDWTEGVDLEASELRGEAEDVVEGSWKSLISFCVVSGVGLLVRGKLCLRFPPNGC